METLLDQCLTSLILETRELREKLDVIVVIDGATDRSSNIAHSYADKFPEMFVVIDKENGNYGSCINVALPFVKGKYVRILDADDCYVTENLPEYLMLLSEINVDLVLTDFETVTPDGVVISKSSYSFSRHESFSFSQVPSGLFISMHSVTYLSDIFSHIDYYQTEGVSYTDLEWVFHPMTEVQMVYYYDRIIYRYLEGREGQTVDPVIRLKNLSHMEKGLWRQLEVFKRVSKDNLAYNYMHDVITYRTKLLYTWGIDKKARYNLAAFDAKLMKQYPKLYKEATSYTIPLGIFSFQMPIVKMWRKIKNKNRLYLFPMFDLYVIVNRIKGIWAK